MGSLPDRTVEWAAPDLGAASRLLTDLVAILLLELILILVLQPVAVTNLIGGLKLILVLQPVVVAKLIGGLKLILVL